MSDGMRFECGRCGKSVQSKAFPRHWSQVPNNICVDLCDECSAPAWEAFYAAQKVVLETPIKKQNPIVRNIMNSLMGVTLSPEDAASIVEEVSRVTHGWNPSRLEFK